MADAEQEQTGGSAGKKIVKAVGIVALCLVALLGGLVVALGPERTVALLQGQLPVAEETPPEDQTAETGSHDGGQGGGHGETAAAPKEQIVVTPFKEIIVNITATTATGRETSRFLKLNLALVYDEAIPGADQVEPRKLFLRDSFQEYLRQLNEVDLEGSIGLVNLKSELLRRARAIADSDAPQEILIADLIVQ